MAFLVAAAAVAPLVTGPVFRLIQRRPGHTPPEPLLHSLRAEQVSGAIFTLLAATAIVVLAGCLHRPQVLIRGAVAFTLLFIIRLITMILVPLATPTGALPMHDPMGQLFYPGGPPETKDLFFSGHTATLALLVALVPGRLAKFAIAAAAAGMGTLLLIQHAHWTIDIIAAPLFAALAWRLSFFLGPGRQPSSLTRRTRLAGTDPIDR